MTDQRHVHPETDWEAYGRPSVPKAVITVPGARGRGFSVAPHGKHHLGRVGQRAKAILKRRAARKRNGR